MLTHSMIPCYKRQIRLCRFLGFKSYKFSKKDETLVELIQFKRYSWSTLLLAIVTLFGFFVPFNGLYVIYRVSTAEMMGDKFGITSLVIIAMTSIAMFADVTALRKKAAIPNFLNMIYNLEKLHKPSSHRWGDLAIIGVITLVGIRGQRRRADAAAGPNAESKIDAAAAE
ncbi:hypothetical protein Fcan01_25300 [Folsomia candida]|uniref:Uncharacterized protein n=1 Tax=Folsomia candida TaxID=158441 RepID=A0A226D547_FOLCA|nr:hypothetical protein Fcan01_25300 [Folsomia candida]